VKVYLRSLALLALFVGLAATSGLASATNLYVAQNSAGSSNGADCADAYGASFFNTSGNWGAGAAQIGPGTTVHLCGTFTGSAGSTMLTAQGSGTSSQKITILFESGAVMTAPYWGSSGAGAINLNGQQYLVLDGGSNGIIKNTANGTGLTYQKDSDGVYCSGCSNDEVRNLTIQNIYVRTPNSSDTSVNNHAAIYFASAGSNNSIHGNTISNVLLGVEIYASSSGASNWYIYNNTIVEAHWGIDPNAPYTGSQLSKVYIYGNDIHDDDAWWSAANSYHNNPIFVRANGNYSDVYVYNNYIHGAIGNATGGIFFDNNSNGPAYVFNNLIRPDSTSPSTPCMGDGFVALQEGPIDSFYIYNNVFDGSVVCGISGGWPVSVVIASTFVFQNNVVLNVAGPNITSGSTKVTSNNNVWYGISNAGGSAFKLNGGYYSYAQWQAAGYDSASTTNSPNLDSTYHPASGSSVIGLGANLTGAGISALDSDKAGSARPTTGVWDAGAYDSGTSASGPEPPTSLSAVPK